MKKFVDQPSELDEVDDDQEMTVAKTDELELEDEGKRSVPSSEGEIEMVH